MKILGIDVGGSGIKGAPVDITTGESTGRTIPHQNAQRRGTRTGREDGREDRQLFRLEGPDRYRFPCADQGRSCDDGSQHFR